MADFTPRFIAADAVPAWLEELAESRTVYVPQREGRAIVYRKPAKGAAPEFGIRPTESAKHLLFPRAEELFRFTRQQDPDAAGRPKTTLQEAADPEPAVVFGAPACDARGFTAFDPVYDGSGTNGLARDTYYLKRRERTIFIVRACKTALSTCFCTWTGGDPAGADGADVLATEVDGGYLLQPITERGESIMASGRIKQAEEGQIAAARQAHEAVRKSMGEPIDISEAPAALWKLFDDMNFWRTQSAGCLSCGACTYLCPTCYCFSITDESNGISGVRLRSWDNCMAPLFTLEASGHNPRTVKAARLRNRVSHKYSYYPKIHEGRIACTGCGRCIKSCPSSVDIRRIVKNAVAAVAGVKEAAND